MKIPYTLSVSSVLICVSLLVSCGSIKKISTPGPAQIKGLPVGASYASDALFRQTVSMPKVRKPSTTSKKKPPPAGVPRRYDSDDLAPEVRPPIDLNLDPGVSPKKRIKRLFQEKEVETYRVVKTNSAKTVLALSAVFSFLINRGSPRNIEITGQFGDIDIMRYSSIFFIKPTECSLILMTNHLICPRNTLTTHQKS